jgi:phage-related protein
MNLDFNFCGVESSTYGIQGNFTVPLLPEKRRNTQEAPGLDGVIDFGHNSYSPLVFSGECRIKAESRAALDAALSSAAVWLSGEGPLILGRSPDKRWPRAKIYAQIDLTYIGSVARFPVTVECNPPFLEDAEETIVDSLTAETDYGSQLPFYPVIVVTKTGDPANHLQLSIASTGRYMLVEDEVVADDVLVFDMATGRVTKNNQDIRSKLLIGSLPFAVPPGAQTITVTTDSTYAVEMMYRKRYFYG